MKGKERKKRKDFETTRRFEEERIERLYI